MSSESNTESHSPRTAPKKRTTKNSKGTEPKANAIAAAKTRATRNFPNCTFEEALTIPLAIQKFSSGAPIRRLTLFDSLQKSPESGPSRQLVTNSGKYGLTIGSYQSDILELTSDGVLATGDDVSPRDKVRARVKLAIQNIAPFNSIYERFVNNKLPSKAVLADAIKEAGVIDSLAEEAVDTFIVNAQFVGLLKTLSGAERFVALDHLLESIPSTTSRVGGQVAETERGALPVLPSHSDFDTTCFYITPIGEEQSEHRQHSDMFLGSIVEPALESFGLKVIRADAIDKPGFITKQVIEYLLKSRLVIADLSYHNPNVFYELAIRHAARLPTVQIIRSQDRIPFDVNPNRTIDIDCTSIYKLLPQLETYKSRIANHVRRALDDADASDNPIALFCPNLKVQI